MFLTSIAGQIALIKNWGEVTSPVFISVMIVQIAGFILSVWGGIEHQPSRNGMRTRHNDRYRTDVTDEDYEA